MTKEEGKKTQKAKIRRLAQLAGDLCRNPTDPGVPGRYEYSWYCRKVSVR